MTDRVPRLVLLLAAGGALLVVLPLVGLVVRAPWGEVSTELASREVRSALRLSLICSLAATALSVLFGLPIAWLQARREFRGQALLRGLTLLPIVLPPVVGGVALLAAFGRRGVLGQWLDQWLGLQLPFSTAGAILAETFVAMPFFILAAEGALRGVDQRFEDAARTLGAGFWRLFFAVTLPLARPALVAGVALAWARALGEFGATITFAGNFPGRTQTVPLAVYLLLESRPQAGIVLSLVLVAISLIVLIVLRDRWVPRR